LEKKIKLCEVLALEDFKAWMKNMKKQGEADFLLDEI